MSYRILVINPGSTSTKVAKFEDNVLVFEESIPHSKKELSKFDKLWDQFSFRHKAILEILRKHKVELCKLDAVVGRGGLLRSMAGGTYKINDKILKDSRIGLQGEHVANLGCALADAIAKESECDAYTVDPVSVDEFEPLARFSGYPLIERRALSHTLNLHEAARQAAHQSRIDYGESNFVVAHLGGGISVAPVKCGRIVDVNDASSDGPFSPERTGGLPLQPFIDMCFSNQFTKEKMKKLVMGGGGLKAYLGTHSAKIVENRINSGDPKAYEVFQAMAYQIAKEIGAMATVVRGEVKAIILTGGLAHSKHLTDWIEERVSFIAPVLILKGEFEMEALAAGVLRVLRGEEKAKIY